MHFFFSARQKQTKKKRRWTSLHAPGASILGSLLSSQTNPELHLPMLWGVSNAWVNFVQFCARSFIYRAKDAHLPVKHILFCTILFKFTSKSWLYLFSSLSVMDVQAFERLLGPCMDIMKRNIANYEEQLVTLFGSSPEIEQQTAWSDCSGL